MKKLLLPAFLLGATIANAQSPAILFLQADANVDCYEFVTLRRANFNNLGIRDAGICSDGKFRTNENDTLGFPGAAFTDVPAGTIFQVKNTGGIFDSNSTDGRIYIIDNLALNNVNSNPTGDQLIAYTGPSVGSLNCGGATGNNTFVGGFNWGNSGWTSGATSSNDSKAPGTAYDFAFPGLFNKVQYTGSIIGNESALVANINNAANWTGTATGDGIISLKNILFNESNYTTGNAIVTPAQTSVTLDLSSLTFDNTTIDTRYAIIVGLTSADIPADRYTCYTGIAPTLVGSPSVALSVSGQTADDFCGTTVQGSGQLVYLNYTLPSSFTINGLAPNTTYTYKVVAVNGNGYTANFSSTAYSSNFSTGAPANTTVEFSNGNTALTVNENVGQVIVPVTISNPSSSIATTVQINITGGTGNAADVSNFVTQTITFPAGSSSNQNLTLNVTDDLLQETTETIVFTLQNISGGQGTPAIGINAAFTLTITDNDAPLPNTEVFLTVSPDTVIENAGQVAAVLAINNPSATAATSVELVITGGTGSPADIGNYTTQTITFPAGSNALQPVSIIITNDVLFENTETIGFAVRNISGGQGTPVIGTDSTFTLTIIDDDIPNIVINEIHYNPSEGSGSPDAQYEFIELYNAENVGVDLAGYSFTQGVTWTFPANSIITPGQYIIVAIDANTYSGQGYDVYEWTGGDLDNNGETIEFRTVGNLLVDIVTYDELAPWPTGANNQGPSLELIDEPLDNALPENWRANGPKNGTPGRENTPLSVNENYIDELITMYSAGYNLYINPTNKLEGNYTLNLITATGQFVSSITNLSGAQIIELPNVANGFYAVQFIGKQGVTNKKLYIGN